MSIVTKDYKSILNTLKTGDIVLFSGNGKESKIIQEFGNTKWSHVGMVVIPNDIKPEIKCDNKPLLWQASPKLNIKEVENKPESSGPEIVYLDELLNLLKQYNYTVAIRNLKVLRTEAMLDNLNNFINKVHMDEFPRIHNLEIEFIEGIIKEKIILTLKNKIFFFRKKKKKSLNCIGKTFFCSELTAQTFIEMGLLPKDEVARSYSPKSFSTQGNTTLQSGAFLENEIYISF